MDLSAAGLNQYESKAYAAVVARGEAPAATIAKASGVPYGRIYDILATLEAKGLVRAVPGKTNRFAPGDPKQLAELLHKQKATIVAAEAGLHHLQQLYDSHAQLPVETATGKANFYRLMKTLPPKRTRDFAIRFSSEYHPEWVRSHARMKKEGVDLKHLVRVTEETAVNIQKWLVNHENIRAFENDGVAISIGDNDVLIGLIKQDTTIVIRDKAFTDIMARLFSAAYAQAPSITKETLPS